MTIEPMLRSLHPQGREQSEHKQMSTEDWHGLRLVGLSVYYTTPWKLNIEPKILEVWEIIFPSKWVICRFHVLIFQGVG